MRWYDCNVTIRECYSVERVDGTVLRMEMMRQTLNDLF